MPLSDNVFDKTMSARCVTDDREPFWTDQRAVLDQATFSACMARLEPFEDAPFLAIGVSGGVDSLALTLLADGWARRRGGRVVGLTVDHGLRSSSSEEARQTGSWLKLLGIDHEILVWTGEKPKTGLQKHARDARYALLADWCRRHHCLHLMTAHHRQDQAETVALRKARRSGSAGLAAMAAIREIQGLRLLRPLLGIDKRSLEAHLRALGQPWLDDPSNDDPVFTRNRMRQVGLDIDSLAGEAERQGVWRRKTDRRVAEALVRHAVIDPAGFATLDAVGFERLPADLAFDLLTRLLMTIGGRIYPPRREALSRLLAAIHDSRSETASSPSSKAPSPGTLAYCRILTFGDRWLICREQPSSERLSLEPDRYRRWDGRFNIRQRTKRSGLTVAALGDKARHGENTLMQKEKARCIPGMVKPTLPALWDKADLIAIPHLGLYEKSLRPEDIDLQFCPHSPLANAPFMPHITA